MAKLSQAQLVEKWILDPLAWAETVLSSPDKPYRPSTQQKEGWESYRRLLTAKLKRAHGVSHDRAGAG